MKEGSTEFFFHIEADLRDIYNTEPAHFVRYALGWQLRGPIACIQTLRDKALHELPQHIWHIQVDNNIVSTDKKISI